MVNPEGSGLEGGGGGMGVRCYPYLRALGLGWGR